MNCFYCRNDAGKTGNETIAILCGDCVQRLTGAPDLKPIAPKLSIEERAAKKALKLQKKTEKLEHMKTQTRGRGRGWHLKKLFEFQGMYYSMGIEITAIEAMKLKNQLAKTQSIDPFAMNTTSTKTKRNTTRAIKRKL